MFLDTEGVSAMRHQNSVLHQILKLIPWGEFERLVKAHKADKHVRRLTTKSQLVAMLYAQLAHAASLREIEAGLKSHAARLYHAGAKTVKRSTLADANQCRSAAVFSDLLGYLMSGAKRGLRRAMADTTYLIDSTCLRLDARSLSWGRFCTGVCGVKLHVIYDPAGACPLYAGVSGLQVHDIRVKNGC